MFFITVSMSRSVPRCQQSAAACSITCQDQLERSVIACSSDERKVTLALIFSLLLIKMDTLYM